MPPQDPVPVATFDGANLAERASARTEELAECCRAMARWLMLGRRLSRDARETRELGEWISLRLPELVAKHGEITLDVTPRALVLDETPVFVAEHANDARSGGGLEHELSWVLHRDGVRRLHFRRGLARESVQHFLHALAVVTPVCSTHEDLVTLLWDRAPAGIEWETEESEWVAGFLPGAAHSPELIGASPSPHARDLHQLWQGLEHEPDVPPSAFVAQWRSEHAPPLAERSSALVEELLAHAPQPELAGVLTAALATWLASATQRGDWDEAREALALIERADPEWLHARPALEHALSGLDASAITDRLDSDTHELQAQAFALAVRIGAPALPLLVAILSQSSRTRVRAGATTALAFAFAEDPSPLSALLADRRWQVVRDTVFVLGQIGGPAVVPLLAQAGRHVDARVRRVAVEAMGQVPAAQARPVLLAQLDLQDVQALRSSLAMLAREPDAQTAEAVLARVLSPAFASRPEEQRVVLIASLPDIAGDAAIQVLTHWLHEGGWFAKPSAVRNAAARALRQLDTPRSRDVLAHGLRHRASAVRQACAQLAEGGPGT